MIDFTFSAERDFLSEKKTNQNKQQQFAKHLYIQLVELSIVIIDCCRLSLFAIICNELLTIFFLSVLETAERGGA